MLKSLKSTNLLQYLFPMIIITANLNFCIAMNFNSPVPRGRISSKKADYKVMTPVKVDNAPATPTQNVEESRDENPSTPIPRAFIFERETAFSSPYRRKCPILQKQFWR